jgi:hypothetical protein
MKRKERWKEERKGYEERERGTGRGIEGRGEIKGDGERERGTGKGEKEEEKK